MKRLIAATLVVACGSLAAASDVYVIEKGTTARVKVGDVIRVTAATPAGQGKVTAAVDGPGKVEDQNTVRRVVDGKPVPEHTATEIDVRARDKGTITITVTVAGAPGGKDARTVYTVEVEEKK